MDSFMDYYQDELRKRSGTGARPSASPAKPQGVSLSELESSTPKKTFLEDTNNPIGWTLDILSRPLFGMTNIANKSAEQAVTARRKFAEGDVGGGVAETAGNALLALPRFLQGMFSNDENDKRYTGDTIEHVTDQFGSLDPNYKNVEDNVNPVAKGVLGFVGDVALDPLTYIPGAQIAKAGSIIGQGVRGAAVGARDAVAGTRGAVKAAEELAPAVAEAAAKKTKAPKVTPEAEAQVFEGATNISPRPSTQLDELSDFLQPPTTWRHEMDVTPAAVEPTLPGKGQTFLVGRMPKQPAAKAAETAVKTTAASESAIESILTGKGLAQIIKESPRTAPMKAEIQELRKALSTTSTDVAVPAPKPTPEGFQAFIQENAAKPALSVQLPGDVAGRKYTVGQLAAQMTPEAVKASGNPARAKAAGAALKEMYTRQLRADSATSIMSGVQAAQARLQRGESTMRNVLGDDVFEMLSGLAGSGKTAALNNALTKLDSIFEGRVPDLDAFSRVPGNARLANAVRTAYAKEAKTAPNTPEVVQSIEEQIKNGPLADLSRSVLSAWNKQKEKYTEWARTNPVAKAQDGTAAWWRKPNTFFQVDMLTDLQKVISDRIQSVSGLPRSEMLGAPRAAAQRKAVEDMGNEVADALETIGIPLYIGTKGDVSMLAFPDVYREVGRVMDELTGNRDVTNLALHNYGTSVVPSRFLNVVNDALQDGSLTANDIAQMIRKKTLDSDGPNQGKTLPNNITATRGKTGAPGNGFGYINEKTAQQVAEISGAKVRKGRNFMLSFDKGGNLPELLAEAIVAARPALASRAEANIAEWTARGVSEAQDISGSVLRQLNAFAADPTKAAQRQGAQALARYQKSVADEAEVIAATPEGTAAASTAVEAAVGGPALNEAKRLVKQEAAVKSGADLDEAGQAAMSSRLKEAETGSMDDLLSEVHEEIPTLDKSEKAAKSQKWDIGEQQGKAVQAATVGTFRQQLGKMFDRNSGLDASMRDVHGATGNWLGELNARTIVRPVKELTKKHSPESLSNAMKAVQQGTRLDPASELGQAAQDVENILGRLFDTKDPSSPVGNALLDSGASVERLNGMLRWAFDGSDHIQFDRAGATAAAQKLAGGKKPTKAQVNAQLKEQWRQWNLSGDPADALVRLGQATTRAVHHQAVASSFINTGLQNGFVKQVAKGQKPPAGFVKIADSTGQSQIASLFPKGTYVAKELAPTVARLEYLMVEPRALAMDLFTKNLVPMTNVWKQGMTIYRLGHHVRNAIGNLTLQYVARGTRDFNKSAAAATKLLARHNNHEGMDFMQALRTIGDGSVPTGGDVLVRGKHGDLTTDEILDVMSKEGLFPTYEVSEGLLSSETARGGLERILRPLDAANNPVGRLGGKVSEGLDHYSRAHHFIQILMQESAKRGGRWGNVSKAELYKRAAREVRRNHPDSSMLTGFENKYMKLAIPFYSWLRGVLPGALEAAAMHPGRVMVFPKASYNLATSLGIDPNSLADPFPEDQLFPSFIREAALGPQFQVGDKYIRMNPGIAQLDISESLGLGSENPVEGLLRGVLGMTNPLARVPAEVASGGSWSTGARINDTSDYVDQSIPFVNYLSNLTGMSLTGSVAGAGLDPQAGVAKGNKDDFDKMLSAVNWLTGLGFQNLSRPNYINYAEIEKRNEAGGK